METFNPPVRPSQGSGKDMKPKVLASGFGDGYSQRAKDGINSVARVLSLKWEFLTPEQADNIESFFIVSGGSEAFLWTAAREATPRKWICSEWRRSYFGGHDQVTAKLKEVFDVD